MSHERTGSVTDKEKKKKRTEKGGVVQVTFWEGCGMGV